MKKNNALSRLISLLGWMLLALVISGENYCQKSFSVASQSIKTATPTATASETPTPDESETATPTATASASVSATVSSSPTPSPTVEADELFRSLAKLSTTPTNSDHDKPKLVTAIGGAGQRSAPSNWLGKIYEDDDVPGNALDSDNDGYSDKLEKDSGSNAQDAGSTPPPPVTKIMDRLQGSDDDGDGLTNDEERRIGSDPLKADTDGDGCSDGAEVLSESKPLDAKSKPANDFDGDCLSDGIDISMGLDFRSRDSDGDGVRDDVEVAMGMSALSNDTDNDGILDGKELELGADPTIPEAQK
jgi:hypothetical protein